MLRPATDLEQFELRANDGELGRLQDFFFDDVRWQVRYFVVETSPAGNSRRVLISPAAISTPDWKDRVIPLALTREEVGQCPAVDLHQPVSREHELALARHYNWPVYWGVAGFPEVAPPEVESRPSGSAAVGRNDSEAASNVRAGERDPHLRSVKAVIGAAIEARDGAIGHVADFMMDDLTWEIRYLLVDTRNWLPGKKVLVAPQWIDEVGWAEAKVHVSLLREAIKESPAYDPTAPVTPDHAGQVTALKQLSANERR